MSEERFSTLEGKVKALEVIVPMVVGQLTAEDSLVKARVIELLDHMSGAYDGGDVPPALKDAYVGVFDKTKNDVLGL